MGRAKLNMELISKEKSRNITYRKRKEGLIRKMHEFTTLCDVKACMIIYGPRQEKGAIEPEIWPQDVNEVHRIIDIYKSKNKDSGNKTFGLSDFFHDRKRRIEEELAKLRKKNIEAKYPTWLELLNFMTEVQLREFAAALSNKAEYVKSKIELLRTNKQGLNDMNLMDFVHARLSSQSYYSSSPMGGVEFEVINHQQAISSHVMPIEMHVPMHYPNTVFDHNYTQDLQSMKNQNSMMMLLMNDNDASTSNSNIQCASFKRQVFYESTTAAAGRGLVEPMICHSPKSLARYYAPPVQQPHYMQHTIMPGAALPQLQFSKRENDRDDGQVDDIVTYQMKNQKLARY